MEAAHSPHENRNSKYRNLTQMATTIEIPASDLRPAGLGPDAVNNLDDGDRDLDMLQNEGGLTDAGRDFITVVLDPFHDKPQRIEGQPSYSRADTIVQCIKGTHDFSQTVGAGPWDLHISLLNQDVCDGIPITNTTFRQCRRFGNMLSTNTFGSTLGNFGPITSAQAASTGANTWPNQAGPPNVLTRYRGHGPTTAILDGGTPQEWTRDNNYMDGQHRIIAIGFEVINTTPLLYRGGSVTVYRQPQMEETVYCNLYDSVGAPTGDYDDMAYSRAPPANVNEAMLLPDSRQWDAALGCYIVGTMQGEDNHFVKPVAKNRVYDGTEAHAANDARGVTYTGIQVAQRSKPDWVPTPGPGLSTPLSMSPLNFATSGAYFHNLPEQTVLTLNWRIIVERAPSVSESDLVVLTSPSPAYDELAWRFYSEARSAMPVGVPLNENFLGSWFKEAAHAALAAVPKLARGENLGDVVLDGVMEVFERRKPKPRKRERKRRDTPSTAPKVIKTGRPKTQKKK